MMFTFYYLFSVDLKWKIDLISSFKNTLPHLFSKLQFYHF